MTIEMTPVDATKLQAHLEALDVRAVKVLAITPQAIASSTGDVTRYWVIVDRGRDDDD